MTFEEERHLKKHSLQVRRDILSMLHKAGSGHPGGSLSAVEILVYLYERQLRIDPASPQWPERDRMILSKGHAAPALYAALAHRGFFPPEALWTLRQLGSALQGHPDMKKTPGVDLSTGSLGLGLSAGLGMALIAQLEGKAFRTYVLMGDGELNEGQNWEAAMAAAKFGAANLTAIVDRNRVQLDGTSDEIMPLDDLAAKFQSFGWNTIAADGHSFPSLEAAFRQALKEASAPTVIIAETIKGKGVAMMEGKSEWHGKLLDDALYTLAQSQLESGAMEPC